MATCPNCKAKINFLVIEQEVVKIWHLKLLDGDAEYDDQQDDQANDFGEAYCPECNQSLGITEQDEAVEFLEGD